MSKLCCQKLIDSLHAMTLRTLMHDQLHSQLVISSLAQASGLHLQIIQNSFFLCDPLKVYIKFKFYGMNVLCWITVDIWPKKGKLIEWSKKEIYFHP